MIKYALQCGLIVGIIGIGFSLVTYLIGVQAMVHWATGLTALALFITLYVVLGIRYRKTQGDVLSFKDAFLLIFVMAGSASLISGAFSLVLYNVIDPDLPRLMQATIIENTAQMMESFGAPQTEIDKTIYEMQQDAADNSIGAQLMPMVWGLVGSVIFAAIIGLCIKKKPKTQTPAPQV